MYQARTFAFAFFVLILLSSLSHTLHAHDNEYVHPYITEQAFSVWPNDTSHEIYAYLGMGLRMPCGGNPACYLTMCDISKDGALITEGVNEEDWYDPVGEVCTGDALGYGFHHHFYDPDVSSPNNGLCDDIGALSYAKIYWLRAKQLYPNQATRGRAYWYLGRIAHLIGDMTVPAHVLRDAHPSLYSVGNPDSYEKFVASHLVEYRSRWSFIQAKALETLNPQPSLDDLFFNLAERTQYFPSNDKEGNTSNSDDEWFAGWPVNPNSMRVGLFCKGPNSDICDMNSTSCDIEDANLIQIGDRLMPLAIQYTAALYRLFWNEFHVSISVPDYVTVLSEATANAAGKIDGVEPYSWEWDFAYDGSFNAEASGQTVTIPAERYRYDSGNTKTIALRPNGDDSKIQTTQIFIRPYPISVTFPDGYNSLHRHFSTPSSSLVDTYTWNYGDGSAPESGTTEVTVHRP